MAENATKVDDGGPAFPVSSCVNASGETHDSMIRGMSLRDWFAGQALAGILSNADAIVALTDVSKASGKSITGTITDKCYNHADAMLAARRGGAR